MSIEVSHYNSVSTVKELIQLWSESARAAANSGNLDVVQVHFLVPFDRYSLCFGVFVRNRAVQVAILE